MSYKGPLGTFLAISFGSTWFTYIFYNQMDKRLVKINEMITNQREEAIKKFSQEVDKQRLLTKNEISLFLSDEKANIFKGIIPENDRINGIKKKLNPFKSPLRKEENL